MGGALAGGGATLLVAEQAGLSPAWAGAATGGLALAGSSLLPNPMLKDACFAAGLGGIGVAGVQLLANFYAKKKQEAQKTTGAATGKKRQADGDAAHPFITRDELNAALAQVADKSEDQHKQTCDLMTALHDEIKKVVVEVQQQPDKSAAAPGSMPVSRPQTTTAPFLYRINPRMAAAWEDERNAGDDYQRNAYGDEYERNADLDDRNANIDEYERNAYGDEYERNSHLDERNADEYERNAYGEEERNADERDAGLDERDADAELS
jgi:hypothetical protein